MVHFNFSHAILRWFEKNGRKNLPWQHDTSPYRVWVSEIMLQQTQVSTVIPYFENFMQAFPNVEALAQSKEDKVLHLWSGLGYYARARNLYKTAQIIHREKNNCFPTSQIEIEKLPGIGRSTAGAILSLSMQQYAPILDGNVKRVLSRFKAVEGWSGHSKTKKELWQIAEDFTPEQRTSDYTQAIMDLGATLCTRSKPKCQSCPLQQHCLAHQTNKVNDYPQAKPRKTIPTRDIFFLVLHNKIGEVLLEKRPPKGIWGGLWSLPQHENKALLTQQFQENTQKYIKIIKTLPITRHTFSHFHLNMHPIVATINKLPTQITEDDKYSWYHPKKLTNIGLAAPIKNLLKTYNIYRA